MVGFAGIINTWALPISDHNIKLNVHSLFPFIAKARRNRYDKAEKRPERKNATER